MTHADPAFLAPAAAFFRKGVESFNLSRSGPGEGRPQLDGLPPLASAIFPYDNGNVGNRKNPGAAQMALAHEDFLGSRATFSKQSYAESGRPWWSWHQVSHARMRENDFATGRSQQRTIISPGKFPQSIYTDCTHLHFQTDCKRQRSAKASSHASISSIACAWGRATFPALGRVLSRQVGRALGLGLLPNQNVPSS